MGRSWARKATVSTTAAAHSARAESLEGRLLLSGSATDFKRGPLARIGTDLASVYLQYTASRGRLSGSVLSNSLFRAAGGNVEVEAFARKNVSLLAREMRALQATALRTFGKAVSASVPINQLARLAALPALQFARPVRYVVGTGSVNNQGDAAQRADIARSTYGLTGAGVKVGLISDSFNTSTTTSIHYANDVASGDLPSNVQVLNDMPAGTDEGRAMAQLVYDSAPGASLAFATGAGGQSAFANNIRSLRDAGADIIVDDLIYLDEPMFQDGVIAQAVDEVVAGGVSYFTAANNFSRNSYESVWRAGNVLAPNTIGHTAGAPQFYGGTSFDFDPGAGVADMQSFTLGNAKSVVMSFQWDSPYFSANGVVGSSNDMDIYVLNDSGTQIVGGSAINNLGGDPTEVFQFTNTTGAPAQFKLMLVHNTTAGGSVPGRVKWLEFNDDAVGYTFATNSSTAIGHTNAAGAESVAAAFYNFIPDGPHVEMFSSLGGTPILFGAAGNRLASPVIRQTPDITAPDGGDTTFFGIDIEPNGRPNFFGTSAAAPAAAAVAALMLQKSPTTTPAQIYAALQNTAIDMDDPSTPEFDTGVDFRTGFGMIRADAAIASLVGTVTGTVFQDNNGNGAKNTGEPGIGGVTVFYDANSNSLLDGGEISAFTTGTGDYTLSNVPAGSDVIRAITPLNHVATSGAVTVNLGSGATINVTNFGFFPLLFTGTSGNDSYALQVNASVTTNLDILVGGVLTYTAAKAILPVLSFELGDGDDLLTINYTSGNPMPTDGVNYDGGGNTAAGDALVVNGSNNGETITITNFFIFPANGAVSVQALENATVNGSGGNDTLLVESGFPANVAWDGGTGTNTLTYTGAPAPETLNLTTGSLFNGSVTTTYVNTQTLNLNPLSFNDIINVSLAAGAPTLKITATTSPNTINLNAGAAGSTVTVLGNAGSTTINIASGYASPVSLSGPGSNNAIVLNATTGNDTITATSTNTSVGVTSVTYSNLTFLTINALDGNDTINITSATPAATTVNGGLGNDVLNVNAALASSGSATVFNGGTTASDQDTLNINAGMFQIAGDPQTGSANLTVNDNANLIFTAATSGGVNARHLAALNIAAGKTATVNRPTLHANRAVLVIGALSVNPTATLDLGESDMIVKNGDVTAINALLTTGFAGGLWSGAGINSAAARTNVGLRTALGILKNVDALNNPIYGAGGTLGLFDLQDVTINDVLVKYTWYGDTNLTGNVDAADYAKIDNGFTQHLGGWLNGDFTYDGRVSAADYALMDTAFNSQGPVIL